MDVFNAGREGDCEKCDVRIQVNDRIRGSAGGGWEHEHCPDPSTTDDTADVEQDDEVRPGSSDDAPEGGDGAMSEEAVNVVAQPTATASAAPVSAIELEIKRAKDAAAKRIAELKRKLAKQEAAVDAQVILLLKAEHADTYAALRTRAATIVEQTAAERSEKAKAARAKRPS